jgi:predicted ArsR family transcriptional regulator
MLPQNQANRNQRFVNAEVEIAIPTEAAIIEYCKIPRRKKEIREHFGLKIFQVKSHVDPLIADGRLKGTEPNNPQNYWQRYVSAEYGAPVSLNELILEFCKEPRTRKEIAERTGIDIGKMKSYTQPLVDCGKLKMTNQASPTSPRQRFAAADSNTVILTEETLIELCATPKSRIEIMEHFGYNSVAGMKAFISPLIKSRKLAYLHPEMPMCRWQKYVKAQ